jgi:AraC-like DNA-binding protein
LPDLARQIGMSATKMKRLFRQIFGDSIYNYFQVARMNEAAQMLRNFSVSQVGYHIGFSNLSHFTRLFEKHHQIKPKRFKDRLGALSPEVTGNT